LSACDIFVHATRQTGLRITTVTLSSDGVIDKNEPDTFSDIYFGSFIRSVHKVVAYVQTIFLDFVFPMKLTFCNNRE
jgi:hypothetical protein